jgi:two-component sensor histidine kinase
VPDYALLAFLSPDGRVVADSKRLVEGQDASSRPFFQRARERAVVEDVHDAVMLARLVRGPGGDLARFVDIAAPVRDAEGELVGVVAAHLDWSWAEGVERRMREALGRPASGFRALVVSREGEVLLGPPDLLRQRLPAGVADAPGEARAWPDGRKYLAASAPTRGHLDYPGLGWTVVVRQDVDMRSAETGRVQRSILQAGGVAALLAALLGWLIAGWIAQPLARLAEAGERVRAGAGYDGAGGGAALRLPFREAQSLAGTVEGLATELASAAETRTLLVREADHRVKNSLQTVAAVLALQRGQVPEPAAQAALAEAEGRVRAVAEVHRALYQADVEAGQSVDLGAMLRDLCEQLGRTLPPTVTLRCEPPIGLVHLPAERALPVGLLVAELLGNAAKHAFPDGMGGTVRVELRQAEGRALVEVADDGVGADPQLLAAKRQSGAGLGMRIVDNLARKIGAKLSVVSEPGQGTRVALAF